jgi:tRNA 2-thiouridine synthesizing protein A
VTLPCRSWGHDAFSRNLRPNNAPAIRIVQSVNGTEVEIVDARGLRCPLPSLRLQRALRHSTPGRRVRLLADDPMARIDVPHLADAKGWTILERTEQDGVLSFLIEATS